jgi:hypothetical protein
MENPMKHLFVAVALVGSLSADSALAMPYCGSRDSVVENLAEKFMEHHVASGFQSEAGLLEIWASSEVGTWTILMTHPDGKTCVVASGTHWLEQLAPLMLSGEPA